MDAETDTASSPRRRTKHRGRHPHHALASAFVRTAPPGHHIDGNGLYLYVQPTGARSWIQRLVIRGRRCELGLGPVALVSLAEAREDGDPLADKSRLQSIPTFSEAAAAVIEQKQAGWKNAEQIFAWRNSLVRYAFPRIGSLPVSEITSADVLAILSPIWHAKPVIAKAVRQRLHAVLEWAIAMNLRSDNPADRVRRPVLGPQRNIVEHMRASGEKPADKLAFEFLVLTAGPSRSCARRGCSATRVRWCSPAEAVCRWIPSSFAGCSNAAASPAFHMASVVKPLLSSPANFRLHGRQFRRVRQ